MAFAAIREFLKLQGIHYQAPAKAGELASEMEQYRVLAQAACKEFNDLVSAFSSVKFLLEQDRTSQMDEPGPGLGGPSFLGLSKGEGRWQNLCLPSRLMEMQLILEFPLEVSFTERKKMSRAFKNNTWFSPLDFLLMVRITPK